MALRAVIASLAIAGAVASSPCTSTVTETKVLPSIPLSTLNPWLTNDADYTALVAAGCDAGRDDGEVCFDKPAIGSGLAQLHPDHFLGLTDRGPNQDCEDLADLDSTKYSGAAGKSGKGFPVARFAPSIVHFQTVDGVAQLDAKYYVALRGDDGSPITGLPNTPADDTPYAKDCAGDQLAYDPSGLDPEDLAPIPGTKYVAIVDEYSPSVVLANYETGWISSRNVPTSVAPALSGAQYPIVGDIPDVFTNRRKNRGFEAVVVDKDAKYVIAILQSPMLGPDSSATENNNIIRCAKFDITLTNGVPSLTYAMQFVIEASPVASYDNSANKPKDMKYSGAQYAGVDKFIVLERAKGQVKLFLVDWSSATNVDSTAYGSTIDLEKASHSGATSASVGVVAASKTLVWDSLPGTAGATNFDGSAKQEGFVVDMNDPTTVWMMDDNDFGLEGNRDVEMRKITLGRSVDGATICNTPAHPPAPSMNITPTKTIRLENSQTYRISNEPGAGAAENFDVDEVNRFAYVANDDTGAIDKYDLGGPCNVQQTTVAPTTVATTTIEEATTTITATTTTEEATTAPATTMSATDAPLPPMPRYGYGYSYGYGYGYDRQSVRQSACDASTPSAPAAPLGSYMIDGDFKPTSASVCKTNGIVAGAFGAGDEDVPGRVVLLNADLSVNMELTGLDACFLPDHVKWSDDCSYLVLACEGEGKAIPGGVYVADFTTGVFRGSQVATFGKFDGKVGAVKAAGIRLVESQMPSVDFEPEYVAIVGTTAYVTLQEANAIAVVDLAEGTVGELKPLGFIDRSLAGFALDASNKDDGIVIRNYDGLYGMPQPDSIASYVAGDGARYLVYANEGDAKDDFEARGADLVDADELNRTASPALTALLSDKALLGRLKVTTVDGYDAETNAQTAVYHYGARSFSIMALDGRVVFDSGEWLARIMEAHFAPIFNANGFDDEDLSASQADLADNRSDDKGGEPESLALLTTASGTTYAFVGLERASILCVFDVTDPAAPAFVDAVQNHPYDEPTGQVFAQGRQGDLDPEGLFASAALGRLFVSGSVSNTVSSYDIVGL